MSSEIVGYPLHVLIVISNPTIRTWIEEQTKTTGHISVGSYNNRADFATKGPSELATPPTLIITDHTDAESIKIILEIVGRRRTTAPCIIINDQVNELLKREEAIQDLVFGHLLFPSSPEQFQASLLTATAQFQHIQELMKKIEVISNQLRNQKAMSHARDILCDIHGIERGEAQKLLKKMATSRNISLAAQARLIIEAEASLRPFRKKNHKEDQQ